MILIQVQNGKLVIGVVNSGKKMPINVNNIVIKKNKKDYIAPKKVDNTPRILNDVVIDNNINRKEYYIDTDGKKRPLHKKSDFLLDMMGIEELQGD